MKLKDIYYMMTVLIAILCVALYRDLRESIRLLMDDLYSLLRAVLVSSARYAGLIISLFKSKQ